MHKIALLIIEAHFHNDVVRSTARDKTIGSTPVSPTYVDTDYRH